MPELLLSSLGGKDLSLKNNAKPPEPKSLEAVGLSNSSDFTHMLSSIVDKKSTESKSKEETNLKELAALSDKLDDIDVDIPELSDLKAFLNGHDFTTQGFHGENLGVSLPEFLNQLQSKLDALNEAIIQQDGLSPEQLTGLEFALSQLNEAIKVVSVKTEALKQDSSPALFGFSYNTANSRGEGSQWQKYDPQQLSQNGQLSSDNMSNTGLTPDQLVSKTDRSFQFQMEQLVSEKMLDTNDRASVLSDALIETKDKTINQLSDLQLKSPGDGLKQYSTTLSTPVNAQNWSDELSQKIVWFSGRNINAAEMHLNPAELGPIDVKISVQNEVTTVTFNVNNASVKDLLESSVVRLREMMEANGVNVGEVNIDADSRGESGQQGSANEHAGFSGTGNDSAEIGDDAHEQTITLKETNLVDYFV